MGLAEPAPDGEFPELECQEVPDVPDNFAELLSGGVWHLVDYGHIVRDEDIFLLETKSALRAVQSACDRHQKKTCARQIGTGSVVDKGRTRSFPGLAVIRRIVGIACRPNCYLFFSMVAVGGESQRPWIAILRC